MATVSTTLSRRSASSSPGNCMKLVRFYFKRLILSLVNFLAGPPGASILQCFRIRLLRMIGCRIAAKAQISEGFYIYNGKNLETGENFRLGAFAKVWDFCPIRIGDNLLASHNLTLISATHEQDLQRTD